jgi:phage-related protein
MASWTFYDNIETTGRNPIRNWLDELPPADSGKINYRLRHMAAMPRWSDKWISKYRGTEEIYEFRIAGNRIQYRPLGTYLGAGRYILLIGAIEKGDRIPRSDIETAERRLVNVRRDYGGHVKFHEYDG